MVFTYETTHPWITFNASRLERAGPKLWALLGECQSKCEHIAGVPLRPDVASRLHTVYLAKGALATTAIEGNTLSEEEVLQSIEGNLTLPPSREYLAQEVENIVAALRQILKETDAKALPPLKIAEFERLNQAVLAGLALSEGVTAGEVRTYSVGVWRYRGAPAEDCRRLLERLGDWLEGPTFEPPPGMVIIYGILRAVLAHLYLAWIHPFGDGNGRTARLLEYRILLSCGVPSPAVHLLSNHYNLTRAEYYRQLDRSSKNGGDYVSFIEYAVQGLLDGLKAQLQEIREFQLDVIWRNYVHESFPDQKSEVDRRRRDVVLALSRQTAPVKMMAIPGLNQKLADHYRNKTKMVIQRDLDALKAMGLIRRGKDGSVGNKRVVEAFLPFRATSDRLPEKP